MNLCCEHTVWEKMVVFKDANELYFETNLSSDISTRCMQPFYNSNNRPPDEAYEKF
jgi:hypothetical protein